MISSVFHGEIDYKIQWMAILFKKFKMSKKYLFTFKSLKFLKLDKYVKFLNVLKTS